MEDDDELAAAMMGYRPLLLRVAARVVGAEAAEDAAGDALLRMWRARSQYSGSGMASWAVTICRNGCIDQLRRRRCATVPLEFAHERLPSREPGPEAQYLDAERAVAIRLAVSRLPPGQRAAVWGYYFRGLSVREVAALAGAANAKAQTFRARAKLRRELAGWR